MACDLTRQQLRKGIIMNRETYLNTITSKYLVPHFKAQGYDIPTNK
jgi:hypothetical protein